MYKRKIFDIHYYQKYQPNISDISAVLNRILLNVPTLGWSTIVVDTMNRYLLEVLVKQRFTWLSGESRVVRIHGSGVNLGRPMGSVEMVFANMNIHETHEVQIMINYKQTFVIVMIGPTVYIGFDRFINDVFDGRTDTLVNILDILGINHDKIECGYGMPYDNEKNCESGFYRIMGLDNIISRYLFVDEVLNTIERELDARAKNRMMTEYYFRRFLIAPIRKPIECIEVFIDAMKQYIAYQEKKRQELEKPKTANGWEYGTDFARAICQPCKNKLYYLYTHSMAANRYTKEMLTDDSRRAVEKIIRSNSRLWEYERGEKSLIFHIDDLVPIFSEIALWNRCVRDHRRGSEVIHTVSAWKIYKLFRDHVDEIAMKYIDVAFLSYMWENSRLIYDEIIGTSELSKHKWRKLIEENQCSHKRILNRYLTEVNEYIRKRNEQKAKAAERTRRRNIAKAIASAHGGPTYWDRPVMTPSNDELSWKINNAINENFEYDDPELAYKYMSMKDLFPETEQ